MSKNPAPTLSRRRVFAGAGALGAMASAAALLPRTQAPAVEAAKPAPDTDGGYRVTQHVLRYYQTTKV